MAVKTKRTKQQVFEDLNLDRYPDDEFMELLEQLGDDTSPVMTDPAQGPLEEWTPAQLEAAVKEMVAAKSVGELLAEARKQSSMTMTEVAEKMHVTKGRVNQLEHPEANLEVATVARMAQAMGYKMTITLEPETLDKKLLQVVL
jgi:ribosome-binding protein aMBF1 (putative translation factor)